MKFSLLIAGDIETNPGPDFKILKAVLGSFHQGHPKFGSTSGIQCSCIALYAICFSIVKKISIWKTWELDYILESGDAVFKNLNISRSLFMHELPNSITIENNNVNVEMLSNYYGILSQNNIFENHRQLSPAEIGNFQNTTLYCQYPIFADNRTNTNRGEVLSIFIIMLQSY